MIAFSLYQKFVRVVGNLTIFLDFIFGGILLFETTVGLRRDSSLVSNIVHLADSWCCMKLALVDSLDT